LPLYPASEESWRLARLVIADGLYAAKGRDREKAIPLLLDSPERIARVAREMPAGALKLGHAFWPGALTLVVPSSEALPSALGGGDSIAVRVPDHNELRPFIASCGGALATSSANLSGRPDAVTAQRVVEYLGDAVSVVIDGGVAPGGMPSTVVSCMSDPPTILRQGAIPAASIEAALAEA
jgi:L-threonylcarbamoyladenylate synthase